MRVFPLVFSIVLVPVIILLSGPVSFGQTSGAVQPFIVRGQLTNFQGQQLTFLFRENGQVSLDTLPVDADGRFYLKTSKVKVPVNFVQLAYGRNLLTELCIAPGYDLTLTGDARDPGSFQQSKKISGAGSIINNYQFALEQNRKNWWTFAEGDLMRFIGEDERFSDSVYHVYFDKRSADDKYFEHFKRMARFDNTFRKLNYLVTHADDSITWSEDKAISFVRKNFRNDDMLDHLFRDEYLISGEYAGLMLNEYPSYLWRIDCRKGLFDCNNFQHFWMQVVQKVGSVYSGKIREIALFRIMQNALRNCRSFEELHSYGEGFPEYISALENKEQQAGLRELLDSKGVDLAKAKIGLPAPLFDARDSSGKPYHIADYKGKVIYIDLWASWCGPCREETPYLKSLYEKYKNDDRIVFLSVAVQDNPDNWKKALLTDKPTWLQLLDTDGQVQRSYVANSIPKFILISKQFNIVSFDAPLPNTGAEIERMLNEELAK